MQIGAQYYRPPFPRPAYWEDDIKKMADSGLNTIQLWALWSWIEAKPGVFNFDDYDELVKAADRNGLKVVLSVIPEVQPLWIHRIIPGSEMINHLGHKDVSTNRNECHFGITPGGCTDHPVVWSRMRTFIEASVNQYKSAPNLFGWDAWNELRWNVHAQGIVCYCPHTIKRFRDWLDKKYGGLDNLNYAWLRRYDTWEDVEPGRFSHRPFTEMMAFSHFITERANEMANRRYNVMKALDPVHPVTVHGASPSPYNTGGGAYPGQMNTPVERGNDWSFAEHLDGVGCSSFPLWGRMAPEDFASRMNMIASAAGTKRLWLSEVQGGRASSGAGVDLPVSARHQQRWLWEGISAGAEAVLFWCWRDEVFTTESGGFGIIGADGFAAERVKALQLAGKIIKENESLLDSYKSDANDVGVLFSQQSYYLHWCLDAQKQAGDSFLGCCSALMKAGIGFKAIDENHLDALDCVKILLMPRVLVTDAALEERLISFVNNGGTLVAETECGAYSPVGIFRYPEDRFLKRLANVCEIGRRTPPAPDQRLTVSHTGKDYQIQWNQWLTVFEGPFKDIMATHPDGALAARLPVGKGHLVCIGTHVADSWRTSRDKNLVGFYQSLCNAAGHQPNVKSTTGDGLIRTGRSGKKRLAFAFCDGDEKTLTLTFGSDWKTNRVKELISGRDYVVKNHSATFDVPELKILVIVGDE